MEKILYIEDDSDWLEHIDRKLTEIGYNMDGASNVEKGLEMINSNNYGAIILDGLNGRCFEVSEAIKDNINTKNIYIFSSSHKILEQAKSKGLAGIIKPDVTELLGTIHDTFQLQ
ncbi:MAG: hypothetical protein HQ534_08935 [Armatimonadetes bacterium]|nr:hypothetical protein [Armatimonadota bacterium]